VVDAVGGKGQTGRRPLRRERAKPLGTQDPRVPGETDRKVGVNEGRKGKEKRKEKVFSKVQRRETPERSKSSGEHEVPTRPNPLGSNQGHGFLGESKPLKRRYEAQRSFVGERRSGEGNSKGILRSLRRRKALKSEAQERRELKEVSTDGGRAHR